MPLSPSSTEEEILKTSFNEEAGLALCMPLVNFTVK